MKYLKILIPIAFGALAVIAVLIFSFGGKSGGGGAENNKLIMWGTLEADGIAPILSLFKDEQEIDISYREIDRAIFEQTLVEGLANGVGPDMILFPHDQLVPLQNKLFITSYEFYPREQYESLYARASEIFLIDEGISAFPFAIDPLVMYWNKDLFINEGLALPPKFWREFFGLSTKLTKINDTGDLFQSFVAFGTRGNITHSKEIISAMMMQTGEVFVEDFSGTLTATLGDNESTETVLDFYTEFSNPRKNSYTWNVAQQQSIDAFAAGDLALYFGLASDLPKISTKNPHLDFGIAGIPQIENGNIRSTYGDLYAIGLLKNSPNLNLAYNAGVMLAGGTYPANVPLLLGLAPARADLLSLAPTDDVFPVFYDGAIKTRVWLDPDASETSRIFDRMITLMTVDRKTSSEVIAQARTLFAELIRSLE
jgi:ABC-type glycerol-3-phosphate transport system substrate-binding protein